MTKLFPYLALLFMVPAMTAEDWFDALRKTRKRNVAATANQVKQSVWHSCAPIPAKGIKQVLWPEKKIDLKAKDKAGKPLWTAQPKWVDGGIHKFSEQNSSLYLTRTITAAETGEINLHLGSDDGIAVWLNGKMLFQKEVFRPVAPDQESVVLPLKKGENTLLLKIFNGIAGGGFYYSTKANPVAALRSLQKAHPQIVLLSSDCPQLGGWVTAQKSQITGQNEGTSPQGWRPFSSATKNAKLKAASHKVDSCRKAFTVELAKGGPSRKTAEAYLASLKAVDAFSYEVLADLAGTSKFLVLERHDIRASHIYTLNVEGFRAGGAMWVVNVETGKKQKLVDSPDGMIMNAAVSYDGKKIVFSWRKDKDDSYHLYTINVDGSDLKQVTKGKFIDYDPCWLPDGGIAFVSSRCGTFTFCWLSPSSALFRIQPDGTGLKRLSYNMLTDITPSVLDDGRILFTRWEYIDRNAIPIQSLWTIRPDGSGLQGYFGNRILDPGTFCEAQQIPGSNKIVCTLAAHNGPLRGAIGVIDNRKGAHCQEAILNVTKDVNIGRVDKGNGNITINKPYCDPYPLNDKAFVCSKLGQLQVRDYEGKHIAPLSLGEFRLGLFNAIPIRARQKPRIISSMLPKDSDKRETATVVIQDVYNGLGKDVKRGEVTHLMVVEEGTKPIRSTSHHHLNAPGYGWRGPITSCGAAFATKKVWGTVAIEEDGSAHFKVPARKPIYFLALDKQGRTIQRMRSFTHFAGGEVQSCTGCHADRNYAAPSSGMPGKLMALKRGADELTKPEWGVKNFSYVKMIQPILDKNCVSCHNPRKKCAGVDLTGDYTNLFNVSYDHLARDKNQSGTNPYTSWIPTGNGREWAIRQIAPRRWGSPKSKLADLALDGHPNDKGKKRIDLTDAEKRRIIHWIDLNVPYYDTMDSAHPNRRGMRHLPRPASLERVIADVAKRRGIKLPAKQWHRITNPENSDVLVMNLAKSAGGAARDDKAVFKSKDDPDYRKVLTAWQPFLEEIKRVPRMDMPGAKGSPKACRKCY